MFFKARMRLRWLQYLVAVGVVCIEGDRVLFEARHGVNVKVGGNWD